jgi:hypothetical protein
VVLSSVERDEFPKSYGKLANWRMSKIFLAYWSADFAMDDEHDKLRVKEATNKLASLISSLDLGSLQMPI